MKRAAAIFLYMLLASCLLSAQEKELPNILLFHADDMTWRDCEPYGNPDIVTPAISSLAEEGVCFDNMHTSTAMCSPTRQQLYTGLYPVRSGAYPNHSMVYYGVNSMCHYFGDLGYRVALIGKTHHNPVESFPFEYLGGMHHDGGEGVDIHLDRVLPIIKQEKNPFFLVVSTNQPHSPWNRGPQELYDENKISVPEYMFDSPKTRNSLKRYYAEITYADSLLGQCMQYLRDAGKEKNTIVIFTSEQGSSFPMAKWTCYDLGLKTAFIVKWPGKTKPGSRNNALTQYIDIVPTLLEAAGGKPGKVNTGVKDTRGNIGFDGLSFLDVLTEETAEHRDYVFGIHTTRGIFSGSVCYPVRSVRNKEYKLILNLNSSSDFFNYPNVNPDGYFATWKKDSPRGSVFNDFISKYMHRPKFELYNIIKDPYEMKNLALEEEAYSEIIAELTNALYTWMEQQGDKGIDTEMKALDRQLRFDEESWQGHEEQLNAKILKVKK